MRTRRDGLLFPVAVGGLWSLRVSRDWLAVAALLLLALPCGLVGSGLARGLIAGLSGASAGLLLLGGLLLLLRLELLEVDRLEARVERRVFPRLA
ncbi:hypothetical protein NSPZN2_40682 [Nitrospira defluvii]|uniref:Uncharacterized protein n=1 Tax=Nitrospira defluvii TaxID=330214 RepID=A0ABM8RZ86_9BACT|nr:hypothetical protein NSPZN2_40682 [Nitrospira defluvii]